MTKKAFRLVLGLVLAAFFGYFAFKNISWLELLKSLGSVKLDWAFIGLILFIVGHVVRVVRWALMFSMIDAPITLKDCISPYFSCFALNNLLPFRIGDVLRLFAFSPKFDNSFGIVAATLFVERVLDLLIVLSILLFSLWLLDFKIDSIFNVGQVAVYLLVFGLMLFVFFPHLFVRVANRILQITGLYKIGAVQKFFRPFNKFGEVIGCFQGLNGAKLLLLSLVAWSLELAMFVSIAMAFKEIVNPSASVLAMAAGTLSTAIPAAPGYVGTFHFFVKQTMTLCGNAENVSIAFAVLTHAILWLPVTIAGVFCLASRKGQ